MHTWSWLKWMDNKIDPIDHESTTLTVYGNQARSISKNALQMVKYNSCKQCIPIANMQVNHD